MEEKLYNDIISGLLGMDNQEIDFKWKIEEYLKTFKNQQLTRGLILYTYDKKEFAEFLKIKNMAYKKKDYIVNYLIEKLEDIVKIYIKTMPISFREQLEKIVEKDGIYSYSCSGNKEFSLHFLEFMKNNILGRIYYDKKKDTISIYIPREMVKMINQAIEDKEINKINERYNDIYQFTMCCMDTYGILTIEEVQALCNKYQYVIEEEELNQILSFYIMVDNGFVLHTLNQTTLVCSIALDDEDSAFDFYENLKGKINQNFTLEDIRKIGNNTYVHQLNSYKKLVNWLEEKFEGIRDSSEFLDNFIINDYLYSAQLSIATADKNFKQNIDAILEIDSSKKTIMMKMLKDIYKEYPKWRKRGNI